MFLRILLYGEFMILTNRAIILTLLVFSSSVVMAQSTKLPNATNTSLGEKFAVTADFSLPFGLGIAGSMPILPNELNARARYNFGHNFKVKETTENGFKVTPKVKFSTLGIFADWFPFYNGFRVTGGLGIMTGTKVGAQGIASRTPRIGADGNRTTLNYDGKTYSVDQGDYSYNGVDYCLSAGRLYTGRCAANPTNVAVDGNDLENILGNVTVDVDAKWSSVAPYLGVGFGNPVADDSEWTFTTDLGVYFTGSPKVTAKSSSNCDVYANANSKSACLTLVTEMDKKADEAIIKAREDLKKAKFLPYLSLGVAYNF